LAYELVGTTADVETTEALVDLLAIWMQGARGLPQGPAASAPLADIYISPVVRTLSRAGFRFARYSDDFRIVASSWTEARRAQLSLETAMREVGLAVAPGKLRTWKRASYDAQLDKIRGDLVWDVALEAGEYGAGEPQQAVLTPSERAEAELAVKELLDETRIDVVRTRRMRGALMRLTRSGSELPLRQMPALLRRFPHLTQVVSSYCRAHIENGGEVAALKAIADWLRSDSFRYSWQVGWLLHATCFATKRNRDLASIARQTMVDGLGPWFVRGQAAIANAVHGHFPSQGDFVGTYELSPEAARPDLLAAVLIAAPSWSDRFVQGAATTPLLRATAKSDASTYRTWLR